METIEEMRIFLSEKLEELDLISGIEKIEYLVEIGSLYLKNNFFDESLMIDENKIAGCVSGAYLILDVRSDTDKNKNSGGNKRVYFKGIAEAKTVNGYMAILMQAVNGLLVKDFLSSSSEIVKDFAEKSGIAQTLTPNRANVLGNIYSMMKKLVSETSAI